MVRIEQQHHPCAWREDCHAAFLIAPSRSSAQGQAPMKTARYLVSPSFPPPPFQRSGLLFSPAEGIPLHRTAVLAADLYNAQLIHGRTEFF